MRDLGDNFWLDDWEKRMLLHRLYSRFQISEDHVHMEHFQSIPKMQYAFLPHYDFGEHLTLHFTSTVLSAACWQPELRIQLDEIVGGRGGYNTGAYSE